MSDPAQVLRDFQPKHDFFIGIDSDGCVFDSMEIKHKECFAPMFVKHHNLQAVSKYAREVWDFVNLYSKTRGANRFPALTRALNLLRDRPEVQARNVNVPSYPALDEWMERETKLGNATLADEVEGGNEGLAHIKVWSDGVNEQVADIVHGVPPFPLLRQTLEKALGQADMMVISQTPCDAPGDHKAAKANGVLFFPILPGREEDSWERLHGEALDRFFAGTYAGEYEEELFAEFDGCLPENPSW